MDFYQNRTVEEQANRLPTEYQEHYRTTQLDRIEIDGCEIHGYFEYSFMEEKSYVEQPIRSQDGVIAELENYATFLTPRLIIKYNMMGIEDYRTLMTLLKIKNAHVVTCYDVEADRRVTHEMYFATPSMPIIYQRYLAALGIQDYTIELIGTNRRLSDEQIDFWISNEKFTAYKNETWLSFLSRTDTNYEVLYSPYKKRFVVSNNYGFTGVGNPHTADYVSPYDPIEPNYTYYFI